MEYYFENARTLNHVQDVKAGGKNTAYTRLKYITNGFFRFNVLIKI